MFGICLQILGGLADVSLRSLGLASIAVLALTILRPRQSAARHAVWSTVLAAMIVLPVLVPMLPPLAVKLKMMQGPAPLMDFQYRDSQTATSLPPGNAIKKERSVPAFPRWAILLAAVYLLGLVLFLARMITAWRTCRYLVRRSEPIRDSHVHGFFTDVAASQSAPWPLPQLRSSHSVVVPMTVGFRDPVVLLPDNWQSWDAWKLRAVLAHELAHVRRGDWLINVAASLNRCLYWFHPLAWWLERRLSGLAEQASDDAALGSVGDAARYARAVLDFAAALQIGRRLTYGVAMAHSTKVSRRIDRILTLRAPGPCLMKKKAWAAIVACALPLVYSAAALQVTQPQAQLPPNPGLAQMLTTGSKLSASEAQELEGQLARHSDDVTIRGMLASYYYAHSLVDPFREHVHRLIEQHPESQMALYYSRLQLGSSLDVEHVKTLWLQEAAAHPENAQILANAAAYVGEKDPSAEEDLLKRARQLEPTSPEWVKRLADLLSRAISRSFAEQMAEIPRVEPTFADAARVEIETSNDASVVGTVGEFLASAYPWGRLPTSPQGDFAELLLNRAQALEPNNAEWPAALTRLHATREPAVAPAAPDTLKKMVPRIRVGSAVQLGNLIQQPHPVYPPLAKQARIQGVVRFNVIIGQDGRISDINVISGHPLLITAAQEAVKQWVYRPTLLNGNPVEVATIVDVQFTLIN
jgi:TonB family protein